MHKDTTSHPLYRRMLVATLFSGLVLGAVACSDDDDDTASDDTSETTVAGDSTDGNDDGADSGFGTVACDAWVDFNGAIAAAPEDPAELSAFGETLVGIVSELNDGLPASLAPTGEILADAAQALVDEGSPDALFSPEASQAQTNIGAFAHDDCDLNAVDIEATEYAFDGLPDELPSGRTSFRFINNGSEEHEMILFRRNDDSDATFEELTEAGPDALFEQAAFSGVVFAPSSSTAYAALELEPGTYFMVCTIPTGGDEGAEPHLAHGMHQTVEVV